MIVKYIRVVSHIALLILPLAQAEVITDGSLGAKVTLSGKEISITPELGQQFGHNLFHSFQDFNLTAGETATFSGANSVQNIIARITGGNPSTLDGTLRSTIPNADLYFLNPYGVMFGPNAKLDLQGGFHASTADYLRLQDGGRFDARTPNDSLLTVAPVAAFGFLTDTPATITTQDSTLIVPPTKTLSLIGGNLQFQGTFPVQFDEQNIYATFATSLLHTTGGQLNLASISSTGEVAINNNELTLTGRGGDITLNNTLMDTSGLGSGNLKVRGNRLLMQDSTLQANTLGEFNGGVMDIQLNESLHANSEPYYFNALVSSALGQGEGGKIIIKVPELILNRSHLRTGTLTEANAGNIDLDVAQLALTEGAGVTANSIVGRGKGGQLTVRATESILISGHSVGSRLFEGIVLTDFPSLLDSTNFSTAVDSLGGGDINVTTPRIDLVGGQIASASLGKGNAGNLVIQADNMNITEGGVISTNALETGTAGNIRLNVTDTLFLSGRRAGIYTAPVTNQRFENNQSSISSFSLFGSGGQLDLTAKTIHLTADAAITAASLGLSGKVSNVNIQAENLLLTAGGVIDNSNGFYGGTTYLSGNGIGGNITVQVKQLTLSGQAHPLQMTGIYSETHNQGRGGNLIVQATSAEVSNYAMIAAASYNTGDAGQINLQIQQLYLRNHGSISTAAAHGGGGNIILNSPSGLVYLDNSDITTSVAVGQGSGGNITVENPQFIVLNQGQIKAQADAGQGGNILIAAEHFVPSIDSLVSASSNLGIDGQIAIHSPTEDVGSQILNLSANFLNAASLLPRSCAARVADQRPSEFVRPFTLIVKPRNSGTAPEDLRASFAQSEM